MIDILKSDISNELKNYWYNIGCKLQQRINGIIQILVCEDLYNDKVIIKIFIEKFNFNIRCSFCIYKKYPNIIEDVMNYISYCFNKEIFK